MKILLSYSILLSVVLLSNIFQLQLKNLIIPFVLISLSLLFSERIKFSFKIEDLFFGLKVSLIVLIVPFGLFLFFFERFSLPSFNIIIYIFFAIAIPEEMFFRGFIQEKLGNNLKSIIITSFLFSFAHMPNFIFYRDYLSFLTFFPSLLMGWLYMKTSNIIPSIIFHFLANLFYIFVSSQFMVK